MIINELEARYRQIEAAMREAQRSSWRGITPADVLLWMVDGQTEKQVRQDMESMVDFGRLMKVGRGASRGYRLTTATQRYAHAVKFGLRPRGEVHISWYTELVYEEIEKAVGRAFRDLGRGVLPRDVQPRLPYNGRAEGSLRRDMLAMYMAGRLVRVSGHGARQGYRLPTRIEKLAFALNQGMWPHGTELVMSWA